MRGVWPWLSRVSGLYVYTDQIMILAIRQMMSSQLTTMTISERSTWWRCAIGTEHCHGTISRVNNPTPYCLHTPWLSEFYINGRTSCAQCIPYQTLHSGLCRTLEVCQSLPGSWCTASAHRTHCPGRLRLSLGTHSRAVLRLWSDCQCHR
jgi:hypothetical protein